ncbi:MAG: HAMP domain-containing protein [Defluviitaleaceae bacterium]|nr:HAMP domain-containing protein [Defluviitaleaceae bacterium]
MKLDARIAGIFGVIMAAAVAVTVAAVVVMLVFFDEVQMVPILVVAGLGAVLIGVIGAMWGKAKASFAEPAKALASHAARLADGTLGSSPTPFNPDESELGEIAAALNKIQNDTLELKKFADALLKQASSNALEIAAPEGISPAFGSIADVANKIVKEYTGELAEIAGGLAKLSSGELGGTARSRSGRAHVVEFDKLSKALQDLHTDVVSVVNSLADGNFQSFANAQRHGGAWQKMVEDANSAKQAVSVQINNVETALSSFAKGSFSERPNYDARGEFSKIKAALSNASANLEKYVSGVQFDIMGISNKSRPRGDYPGDFAKIRNSIIDAVDKLEKDDAPAQNLKYSPQNRYTAAKPLAGDKSANRATGKDTNRMSGAKKINENAFKHGGTAEYMRSDFGKY